MSDNDNGNGLKKSRSILLTGVCDEGMVEKTLCTILSYTGDSVEPITIYINTFGGSLYDVFAIVDTMEDFKTQGIEFHTICIGKAMSAGSAILVAGTKGYRFITKNSTVLVHQLSGGTYGTHAELQNALEELTRLQRQLEAHYARHMRCSVVHVRKLMKKDSYMSPREALQNGIIDRIGRW